jgi:hypothetical protein
MSHVSLEVSRGKLLELVLGQVLVVLGRQRNAGNDVAVLNSLKMVANYKKKNLNLEQLLLTQFIRYILVAKMN